MALFDSNLSTTRGNRPCDNWLAGQQRQGRRCDDNVPHEQREAADENRAGDNPRNHEHKQANSSDEDYPAPPARPDGARILDLADVRTFSARGSKRHRDLQR
jgi:hypothetical protein